MNFKLAAFADEASSSIAEQITAMRENGIDYLEIRGVDGRNISAITKEKAREVRAQMDDAALGVWSIGSPCGKIGIRDDFAPHLDNFKHCLELAEILGAKHFRMFSFYVPAEEADGYADEVMARLDRFIEAAKGSGILLCHENEKGIFGDVASRCELIHKTFPELRAVFDPANFIQCKQDTREAWDMLAPYVEYLHIKDALHDRTVVPAGKGEGNLPYILEQYRGTVLTVEPHLAVFAGLDQLEAEERSKRKYVYPTPRAAFDAAVAALRELI